MVSYFSLFTCPRYAGACPRLAGTIDYSLHFLTSGIQMNYPAASCEVSEGQSNMIMPLTLPSTLIP
jgi:hypothetical protein